MKRGGRLARRTRLNAISPKRAKQAGRKVYSTLAAPTKPLRDVNPDREAKRRQTRRRNHARYRASATFTVVEQRAAGQCEGALQWELVQGGGLACVLIRDGLEWMAHAQYVRCGNTGGLQHHHRSYFRAGGNELPSDMTVLCKRCHEWIERVNHPSRRNGR